jgi:hypothetical protein
MPSGQCGGWGVAYFYNTVCPPGNMGVGVWRISTIPYALRAIWGLGCGVFYNTVCPPGNMGVGVWCFLQYRMPSGQYGGRGVAYFYITVCPPGNMGVGVWVFTIPYALRAMWGLGCGFLQYRMPSGQCGGWGVVFSTIPYALRAMFGNVASNTECSTPPYRGAVMVL